MGTTVFLDAKVHALRLTNGEVGYVWSEETYDKKSFPHKPHWCVMAIGDRKHIVKRVFELACALPGGSLQTKTRISTIGFINKMMNILDNPEWVNKELPVQLNNSQSGFSDAINDVNREEMIKIFDENGKHEWANDIKVKTQGGGKNIVVNLRNDFDLLAKITQSRFTVKGEYSSRPVAYSWQIISKDKLGGTPECPNQLTLPKVESKSTNKEKPVVECYVHRFEKINLVFEMVFCEGKQLTGSIEEGLIKLAAEREEFSPGYYKPLLTAYKDAEKRALPMSMKFSIDVSEQEANSYLRDRARLINEALGREESEKFFLTLDDINTIQPDEQNALYWAVRFLESSQICSVEHPSLLVDKNQLSLIDEVDKQLSLID